MTAVPGTAGPPHYDFSYGQPGPDADSLSLEFRGKDSGVVNTLGTSANRDLTSGEALELFGTGTEDWSMELWFWAATPAIPNQLGISNYAGFLISYSAGVIIDTDKWRLYLDGDDPSVVGPGTLYLDMGSATLLGTSSALQASPVVPEAWNHVVVSYDGTTLSLYLAGALADSATLPGASGAGRLQLGRPVNRTFAQYLEGRIAHVALYTEALDAATIADHAGGGGGGGGAGPPGPPGPAGPTGATGAQGPAGPGVAAGGTTGQVLKKTSAVDYATAWQAESGGGGVAVKEDGVTAGTRGGLNFHEAAPVTNTYASVKSSYATYATLKASSRVTIALADDAANNEVDITIGVT